MKSITLTKLMREDILNSVIDKWKDVNPMPDIVGAEDKYAMYIWNKKFKQFKKVLDEVPTKFVRKTPYVQVCINGTVERFNFKDDKKMPCNWSGYSAPVLLTIGDDDKQYSKYLSIKNKYEEWKDKGNEVKRETHAILDSVNTTKQLIELWPQAEPFLPAHIANPDKAIRLPAIQISRLNERIGLGE